MRTDPYKAAIEAFMAANPVPWRGHPETCKWHPRPNLVTTYRRGGFLWLTKVRGGNCTGCGWRVEGVQWRQLLDWEEHVRNAALDGLRTGTSDRRPEDG